MIERIKELEFELEQERATVEGYLDLYVHTRRKNQVARAHIAKLRAALIRARDAVEFEEIINEANAVLKETE